MNRWIPVFFGLLVLAAGSAQARPHFRTMDSVHHIHWGSAASSGNMRVRGLPAGTELRGVVSPRDAASGMATGKRIRETPSGMSTGKREPGSGLSTGRRQHTRAGGLPTGKRQHKPIRITKHVDKATPMIRQAHGSKRILPQVVLRGRDSSGQAMTIKLTRVLVTSYSFHGSGDAAMEEITLVFEEVEWN